MSKHPFGSAEPRRVPCPPASTTTASLPSAAARSPAASHRATWSESPAPPSRDGERGTTEPQGSQPALRAAIVAAVELEEAWASSSSAPSATSATASAEKSTAAMSAARRAL